MKMQNSEVLEFLLKESNKIDKELETDIWQYKPVSFAEFISDHLKLPSLSERQYYDCMMLLGDNPEKVFDGTSPYNMLVLLAGKGSGKDYMASIVVTYCFYLLLCMRDPHKYFDTPAGHGLDMLIVSFSAKQALEVSFDRVKQCFKHWKWLERNYSLIVGEKYITAKGRPEIHIYNDKIISYNNIRIFSEHSMQEAYEGYNVLVFVLSESSAFKSRTEERNADKVLSTLKTSASSRFGKRWKGIIMSFPRHDVDLDFTYNLYELAKKKGRDEETGINIWASKGATWDFLPAHKLSGKTFEFEGQQIPIEFRDDFELNPVEAKMKFLCEPPIGATRLIPSDVISKSVHAFAPLITAEQYVEDKKIRLKFNGLVKDRFVQNYLITVDLGEVMSATAMALQHLDADKGYVLDALWAWTPDPKLEHGVDYQDVKRCLFDLGKLIPQVRIGFDQWQSILFKSDLNKVGVQTLDYSLYKDRDYGIFRKGMAAGVVHLLSPLHCPEFLIQLKALKEVDGITVLDKKMSLRKDLVDVVVGGFKVLLGEVRPTALPGYTVRTNIQEFGMIVEEAWK
jgi:hypothetical protein